MPLTRQQKRDLNITDLVAYTMASEKVINVRIGAALRGGGELVQRIKTSVLINLSYDEKQYQWKPILEA